MADPGSLGIVIGGSGNGEAIAANKIPGVRAAVAWTVETAQLGRQHNDANVLSLGARMYPIDDAVAFTKVFVETPFSGAPGTPGGWPRSPTTRRRAICRRSRPHPDRRPAPLSGPRARPGWR